MSYREVVLPKLIRFPNAQVRYVEHISAPLIGNLYASLHLRDARDEHWIFVVSNDMLYEWIGKTVRTACPDDWRVN